MPFELPLTAVCSVQGWAANRSCGIKCHAPEPAREAEKDAATETARDAFSKTSQVKKMVL